LIPSTGRELARKAGIRSFSTNMLFQPADESALGTRYLRSLLSQWDGKWEETLASYNAGKSRVLRWITWGDYREPAEFVETIPFTETREYVQSVFRNAAAYRRIYGTKFSAEIAPRRFRFRKSGRQARCQEDHAAAGAARIGRKENQKAKGKIKKCGR